MSVFGEKKKKNMHRRSQIEYLEMKRKRKEKGTHHFLLWEYKWPPTQRDVRMNEKKKTTWNQIKYGTKHVM